MKYNKNPQVFREEESDRESTPAKKCDPKAQSLEGEEDGFWREWGRKVIEEEE